ncbi:hypothetical protein KI688_005558 [Linnemannia hyalina]|uniref:MICOS complex subunit n=1 Tax=Linnemannia hyalina TaxID=64524 RepID=A0A9P7Y3B3_9FUNG|nr:hypothetical protein KI688_005558 [Linnemannia hyalina]
MYRVKTQSLVVTQRVRNPRLLATSTVALVAAGSLVTKTAYCQHDSSIQAEADDLKEAVQEFADHILQLADSPYDKSSPSSSPSSGRDHGHSSPFFSSMGHRSHHGGFGFRSSDNDGEHDGNYHNPNHSSEGNVSSFRRGGGNQVRGVYVEEPLVPALFYITVAGLTGSILARRSNFLFRFLSPVALALGASAYCIPKTTNNVIHGLRTYDYTQWSHDMQHKYFHAKKSIVDTTTSLTSATGSIAGSVVQGAQGAAHDLAEKTHELTDKTQHLMDDVKEKGKGVAHEIQDKGESLVKEAKGLGHDLTHKLDHAKDEVKDQVEDGADHAKHWWNSEKKSVEKGAKDLSKTARQTGEDAKDWARSNSGFDRHDVERGFERFKSKAQDEWDNARDEMNDVYENGRSSRFGRDARHKFESWKDSAEDWAEDRSRDARGTFERNKDSAQDWAEDRSRDARRNFNRAKGSAQDWAQDRGYESRQIGRDFENRFDDTRSEFKKYGREAENQFGNARDEVKKHGREARDFSEDRFRDARRDIRNRAEDLQDHGRRQLHKFEHEADDRTGDRHGGWGFEGDRNTEDFGGRRGRYEEREEYGGRRDGWNADDSRPRRSVTEAAKEGKSWWSSSSPRHNSAADPYESYDRDTNNRSTWWKAGSGTSGPSLKDSARDEFSHLKHQARRGADRIYDNVDDKVQDGQSWLAGTKHDLQDRFQHAKHDMRNKFAHDQGREFGGLGKAGGHNHESIYSHDNWFHYDHGEEAMAGGRRGRGERGL